MPDLPQGAQKLCHDVAASIVASCGGDIRYSSTTIQDSFFLNTLLNDPQVKHFLELMDVSPDQVKKILQQKCKGCFTTGFVSDHMPHTTKEGVLGAKPDYSTKDALEDAELSGSFDPVEFFRKIYTSLMYSNCRLERLGLTKQKVQSTPHPNSLTYQPDAQCARDTENPHLETLRAVFAHAEGRAALRELASRDPLLREQLCALLEGEQQEGGIEPPSRDDLS